MNASILADAKDRRVCVFVAQPNFSTEFFSFRNEKKE
jgi:hypothetical protein